MIEYGTNVVAGVTPGKGGTTVLNRPVFNTMREAVEATGAEASLLFVPPAFSADAMMEAAEAGIKTAVSVTDGIPAQDMMRVKRFLRRFPREKKRGGRKGEKEGGGVRRRGGGGRGGVHLPKMTHQHERNRI